MGFDIIQCVLEHLENTVMGKQQPTIPAKSMDFLPWNHHEPTWTIVWEPPWPAQVVDICLIFTPMRTRTPPRRLASPMAWPTRMARDRSRRDGNDIESGVFLLNSYRKPWKLDWKVTLPETNIDIAPEKWWFPIGISFLSGLFSGDILIWICYFQEWYLHISLDVRLLSFFFCLGAFSLWRLEVEIGLERKCLFHPALKSIFFVLSIFGGVGRLS